MVERRHWLSADEFVDALAMCQLIPGPNIVNFATALGGRFHGVAGAVCCVSGLLLAPMGLVILASLALEQVADRAWVVGALHGMAAVASAMVVVMATKVAMPAVRRGDVRALAVAAVAFVAIAVLRLPLLASLLVLAPAAVLVSKPK